MNSVNPFAQSYQLPEQASSGSYMKLRQGKNKIRILQDPIAGWLYWSAANRPVRLKEAPVEVPADIRRDDEGKAERIKHFWAMIVWNYASECVCILEITQTTIQKHILALSQSDWGSPLDYDLEINRTGEKLETEYTVLNLPPKPVPPAALKSLQERPVDLMALFDGADPFSPKSKPWEAWTTMDAAIVWAIGQCRQSTDELKVLAETAAESKGSWSEACREFYNIVCSISSGDTDF
jgi:hypothetical protein